MILFKEIKFFCLLIYYVCPTIKNILGDDQKRISTAKEAINNGANYIVIGREITNDIDPSKKIGQMLKTISSLEENN